MAIILRESFDQLNLLAEAVAADLEIGRRVRQDIRLCTLQCLPAHHLARTMREVITEHLEAGVPDRPFRRGDSTEV